MQYTNFIVRISWIPGSTLFVNLSIEPRAQPEVIMEHSAGSMNSVDPGIWVITDLDYDWLAFILSKASGFIDMPQDTYCNQDKPDQF